MQDIKQFQLYYKNDNDNHIMRSLKMQEEKIWSSFEIHIIRNLIKILTRD